MAELACQLPNIEPILVDKLLCLLATSFIFILVSLFVCLLGSVFSSEPRFIGRLQDGDIAVETEIQNAIENKDPEWHPRDCASN